MERKLQKENAELKQQLEERRGLFQIECPHCGRMVNFFISSQDISNVEMTDDIKNSPCYFAKKCENKS